jgi:hypothetical protein
MTKYKNNQEFAFNANAVLQNVAEQIFWQHCPICKVTHNVANHVLRSPQVSPQVRQFAGTAATVAVLFTAAIIIERLLKD